MSTTVAIAVVMNNKCYRIADSTADTSVGCTRRFGGKSNTRTCLHKQKEL